MWEDSILTNNNCLWVTYYLTITACEWPVSVCWDTASLIIRFIINDGWLSGSTRTLCDGLYLLQFTDTITGPILFWKKSAKFVGISYIGCLYFIVFFFTETRRKSTTSGKFEGILYPDGSFCKDNQPIFHFEKARLGTLYRI